MADKGAADHKSTGCDIAIFYMQLGMGGVPRLCVWLANGFASRGYRVDLVIANTRNAFPHDITKAVQVIDLGANSVAASLFKLTSYLNKAAPKNVLSFVANAIAIAGTASLLSRHRTNFIACEQIETAVEIQSTKLSAYKCALWMIPLTYRSASRLAAASKGVAESLARVMRIKPSAINVIYNPAFRDEIIELSAREVDHPWLQQNADRLIITAARFVPQKDLATLINAFALTLKSEPSAKLVIIGDGPQRSELEQLAKSLEVSNSISMPGADANPFRWFSKAKVFAMSSRWEGFGMTIVEAMACGCNIVSTRCPSGPSEILADGRFGSLVPVGDIGAMAQAMVEALRLPRANETNLLRAKDFSLTASIDEYIKLFKTA